MHEQRVKCWPGCRAELVGEVEKGRRVAVLYRMAWYEEALFFEGHAGWVCQPLQPICRLDVVQLEYLTSVRRCYVRDSVLRPLPDDEEEQDARDLQVDLGAGMIAA